MSARDELARASMAHYRLIARRVRYLGIAALICAAYFFARG